MGETVDDRRETRGSGWRWWTGAAMLATVAIGVIVWRHAGETAPARRDSAVPDAVRLERLGLSYLEHGQVDEAEQAWKEAERLDPENVAVCVGLGRLSLSRGHGEEAATRFERALKRSPLGLDILYNLSQAYRMMGRIEEAERYRRLADRQRRVQPPSRTGMGADLDFPGDSGSSGKEASAHVSASDLKTK